MRGHEPNADTDGVFNLPDPRAALPPGAHMYRCGPSLMLDVFRKGSRDADIPSDNVQAGETILQALINHGVNIPYSCEEGICGACETRVIEGIPDHRDMISSDREKQESKTMLVCCSGSKSPRLVLDL
jgi:tetrachlorobenzoquinone reductase